METSNLKNAMQHAQDLQGAMASNPFNNNTSTEQRNQQIQEAAGKVNTKTLMTSYVVQFQMQVSVSTVTNFVGQDFVQFGSAMDNPDRLNAILSGLDLNSIGYKGKPLQNLTQEEAKALVSEDGFFGIPKTSSRIADFVLAGAGDDIEKLKAGRAGILQGYEKAEKAWGGKLPDISKKTLEEALAKVDSKLSSLGVNVLDTNA